MIPRTKSWANLDYPGVHDRPAGVGAAFLLFP